MWLIIPLTLLWFVFLLFAIIAAAPWLFFLWLVPKLFIHLADKLNVSNCYVYVWRQFFKHGGSMVFTKSDYGWWWHMLWVDLEEQIFAYQDKTPGEAHQKWKRIYLPPLWFKGIVVKLGEVKRDK